MSLISDPDFLIHSLRLSYLRTIEDPYGSRIISLSQSSHANPFIASAGLADIERWPELNAPPSPTASDDERPRPSGFPGASGLRHTQTIMGPHRTGALGMRVNAKRQSGSFRARSMRAGAPTADAAPHAPPDVTANGASEDTPTVSPQTAAAADTGPPKQVLFVPKFKGAAEMETRRRQRMAARARNLSPVQPPPPAQAPKALDPELSSSEEEERSPEPDTPSDSTDSDFGEVIDGGMSDVDSDGDEFDPEFAAPRPGAWESGASLLSSETDLSVSYALVSPPAGEARPRGRLSPVTESHPAPAPDQPQDSYFEMVTPSRPSEAASPLQYRSRGRQTVAAATSSLPPVPPPAASPDMTFGRRPVQPMRSQASALTALLAVQTGGPPNPFAELYGAIAGRGANAVLTVRVYFPHARAPAGEPMDLNVRADATVEEVLGFALWTYWEEGWSPKIGEGLKKEEEEIKMSAIGWVMRIAEEDGEVDEDFPPPDRSSKISKFGFEAYAIVEASASQVQQNQVLEAKIQRRPSRIMAAKKKPSEATTPSMLAPPTMGTTAPAGLLTGGSTFAPSSEGLMSTSLGPSSAHGPQLFLRIRVADVVDAVHVSTTLPVSAGMYMAEVLESLCKKRRLGDPRDYALVLEDILIPLDRTVASLQGKMNLVLVKKSMLPELGLDTGMRVGRTTDPNASIFKRMSEVPDNPAPDYTAAYKKYNVLRKMPMLGRHERILAIDGVYIHLMPSASKARVVFENARTVSYHVKSVAAVQQSGKSSAFKLVVHRDGGAKRYEFEAETAKQATEIVNAIKGMKNELERKGTVNKSRRSRHVAM